MFDEACLPDHALMQDPAFAQALRMLGQKPLTLPSGEIVLQQRFAGMRVAMLPRASPPPDLDRQLANVGLARVPVILSPDRPGTLPRCIPLRGAQNVAVLDLTGGQDTCRARLHPKWRNQLKGAEKHKIRITHAALKADPNHPVLQAEQVQSRQRGYANWPAALTAAFAAAAPRQTHLFEAIHQGQRVAHMLFLRHGAGATYHIGHTTPDGRDCGAHNLILWQAARRMARLGCQTLDLGVLPETATDLNRFKLRTGAVAQKTGGTHLYWRPFARR